MSRAPRFDLEEATAVRDDLESLMIDCGYLEGAPFEWVTISLRYGLKNEDEPHYERINKKYGDLPLAIELDVNELRSCDRAELRLAFERAALKALVHAGEKYGLEHALLRKRLATLV